MNRTPTRVCSLTDMQIRYREKKVPIVEQIQ